MTRMIRALEELMHRAETWPKEQQEEAVRLLLAVEARATSVYQLSEEEAADIEEALQEMERGEVGTEEEVKAVFDRFRA